jgi:N-acetylated-alpha-linked acidic dipeptidase
VQNDAENYLRYLAAAAVLLFTVAAHSSERKQNLRGYTPDHSIHEVSWEQKFRMLPDRNRIHEDMRRLSARPHHTGSSYDKKNAEWLLAQLRSYGLEAHIEEFSALFPTPKLRLLELLGPEPFTAKLEEPPIGVDPTSSQTSEGLAPYNAYSRDGDVTAPLVYVNYGRPEDYEVLDRMGVSVKGAIVIARYGMVWRGIKPKVAAEHGAVGCILYSDPHEDGYYDGDPYPKGPMRPPDGVQRGSVMDISLYPGDPQTPDAGAVPGAKLVPQDQVKTITKIPVLPVSYADATPLLKSLGGETVPESWRGSLPFTYHTGPSTAKVHLAVAFHWERKPLYDVIARIPGSKYPDQWVLRGNHYDAWVKGAADPLAGTSAELEEARAFGELMREGWHPRRTILYCFWDGEEPGMLGSTEWAEAHAEELRQRAVAYFNTDGNGRGYFRPAGSHSLEHFVNDVVKDIRDPETQLSVWKRTRLVEIANAGQKDRAEIRARADLRMPALGGGSDYITFLDHLGIASVDFGYGGEDELIGQYHSAYDDIYFYTHFEDTDFSYAQALSETAGTMVMRMADADLLPFQFSDFADTIQLYLGQLKKLVSRMRDEAEERNREISEGVYKALNDPKKRMISPPLEPVPPNLDFAPLDHASAELMQAAQRCDEAFTSTGGRIPAGLNLVLIRSERILTDPQGLPGRSWYRNLIYAPGLYTGYAPKTIPGVREAIEQKQWELADAQIGRVSSVLEKEAGLLNTIAEMLADKGDRSHPGPVQEPSRR